jgi:hypothetical protein
LVIAAAPRIVSTATVLAVVAWLSLSLGLVYANFFVSPSLPNPVIVFSAKGLTSLVVELASFGIGSLGLLLVAIAFFLAARSRALAFAAIGNASVCAVCVALLM